MDRSRQFEVTGSPQTEVLIVLKNKNGETINLLKKGTLGNHQYREVKQSQDITEAEIDLFLKQMREQDMTVE